MTADVPQGETADVSPDAPDFAPEASGELTVHVDPWACAASGQCVMAAPAYLALDDGHARSRTATAPGAAREHLVEVAELCPTEAITVRLAGTGERIAPRD
ncbi:ferredoxin [Streptomyces sp. NPDC006197]|uniref:ferredoxin n=1 Tax=Streptomyces sp. NPDC006197 TaxID=3156685 RepID=UPI00339E405C